MASPIGNARPANFNNARDIPGIGIDIELLTLLSEKLGLKLEITDVKFPALIPGVTSGRFDVAANQLARNADRVKVVDFIVYFRSVTGLLVRKGRGDVDVNNLCGRSLALTQGSNQIVIVQKMSENCVKEGKKEIAMSFYPNSADTYLAVSHGRADGFMSSYATGSHVAKHNDALQMAVSTLRGTSTIGGIVVNKGNDKLYLALRLAMEDAIKDGSYLKILQKYGVENGAMTIEEVRNPPDA
ncbi:MAG: transporter substrate-binding domain-containing protein [Alphaproteobacteria bacterium]|nr:transporter substrate-binding domain-containing protein [Alphaproteobacteria bacterium]